MAEPINKGAGAGDMNAAIAAALEASKFSNEEDLEELDETLGELDDSAADTPAQGDAEPSTAQATQASEDAAEGGETATADVPESYWGVDLTGIPVEKRAEILAHFEQQDGTIQKLQERLATPAEVQTPAAEDSAEVSDEELLSALGVDPEDFSVPAAMKASMLLMARNQLALEDQVTQLRTVETGRAVESKWTRELNELEETYGKLPGTREQQLRYAGEENITSPADLYFKLSAPVKREVEGLAAAARREAEKRVQGAAVKPRSSSAEPPAVTPGMSIRQAVREAAKAAQKETGLSWKMAVKRRVGIVPEGSETQ
jgi:hypothetical protein